MPLHALARRQWRSLRRCRRAEFLRTLPLEMSSEPAFYKAALPCSYAPERASNSCSFGYPGNAWRPLCRCRRAWLPPASTWMFPPRSPLHDSGGWYIEWGGYRKSTSPLCANMEHRCSVDCTAGGMSCKIQ